MIKEYTCIICPNGCEIEVELDGKTIKSLDGALCKKGKEYVEQELTNPQRNIATSVKVKNGDLQLVSVRLNKSIPKEKIFEAMKEIKKLEVEAPVKIGDVVKVNLLNLEVDVIATKNIDKVY
ncbi:DUF1667 domain-containing protein [Romboutsia sp.]|uniref:DUF1667 domain-containing protein n=1 Tax=Romboutsia sp. TaxID=1965302 RepID=UPI003F2C2C86